MIKKYRGGDLYWQGLGQTISTFAVSGALAILTDKMIPTTKHSPSIFILFLMLYFLSSLIPRITGVSNVLGSRYFPYIEKVKKDFNGLGKDLLIAIIFALSLTIIFYYLVP